MIIGRLLSDAHRSLTLTNVTHITQSCCLVILISFLTSRTTIIYSYTRTEQLAEMKKLANPMDKLKMLKKILDSYALMSNFKKQLEAAQNAAGLNALNLPNFCLCPHPPPKTKAASFFETHNGALPSAQEQHDAFLRRWESEKQTELRRLTREFRAALKKSMRSFSGSEGMAGPPSPLQRQMSRTGGSSGAAVGTMPSKTADEDATDILQGVGVEDPQGGQHVRGGAVGVDHEFAHEIALLQHAEKFKLKYPKFVIKAFKKLEPIFCVARVAYLNAMRYVPSEYHPPEVTGNLTFSDDICCNKVKAFLR